MFNEPRNWKWMVPAAGVALVPAGGWWLLQLFGERGGLTLQCLAVLTVPIAFICLVQAVAMFKAYYRALEVGDLERRQKALSTTADSVRLEAARNVPPQTLELLLRDRARRWELISGSKSPERRPYSVLHARPNVTEMFVVHFLKMSNAKTYMPKNLLSDGDKSFDPYKITTAYEMYDELESLLIEEGKATRPGGKYKPGWWIPDWDAEAVAADYGVDLESWTYEEETTAAAPLSAGTLTSPQTSTFRGRKEEAPVRDGPEPDWEGIRLENERYAEETRV